MSLPHQKATYKDSPPQRILRLRPVNNEGCYIRAAAVCRGISLKKIAASLNVSRVSVANVVSGRRRSARIEAEIARILGKADWNEVVLEARSEVQGKPVAVIRREMTRAREYRVKAARQSMQCRIDSSEVDVVDLRRRRRGA